MTPDAYCQQKASPSGSSLYYALLFLPDRQRRALTALHAFCHEIIEIADTCQDPGIAASKLAWWEGETGSLFKGVPTHPITQALAAHLQNEHAPIHAELLHSTLHSLLQGGRLNLNQTRYLDWPALRSYCQQTAGVLGRCMACVGGQMDGQLNGPLTTHAENLGVAVQLVRIIRNVGRDARHGRIYLPINELQQFDVKAADILNHRHSPQFEHLMQYQAQRARQYWRKAVQHLPPPARRALRPNLALSALFHSLLAEIERERWQVLHQRIALTPLRKFWLAWRTWSSSGRSACSRLGA